jgi:hypothetical protein
MAGQFNPPQAQAGPWNPPMAPPYQPYDPAVLQPQQQPGAYGMLQPDAGAPMQQPVMYHPAQQLQQVEPGMQGQPQQPQAVQLAQLQGATAQQPDPTSRLEENRPAPLLPTNQPAVRRGLFNFFRRGGEP